MEYDTDTPEINIDVENSAKKDRVLKTLSPLQDEGDFNFCLFQETGLIIYEKKNGKYDIFHYNDEKQWSENIVPNCSEIKII
ncbi:MAG: hypothetical protein LBQ59_02255 [Candidatus Peribacteria bacterium]|jgi:hypothetical protein|nr:hypothetical protein [Candidatus Peribacteria bacterium]